MLGTDYVLVTPARNEEATLEFTIRSVLAQSLRPKEWVIVSDGSTDRTDEIVRNYAIANPFMRLVRLDNRPCRNFASVVFAAEAGWNAIKTREYTYLGLLDADVRFPPEYFETLVARLNNEPRLGLAGGVVLDVVKEKVRLGERPNVRDVAGAVQFFRRTCFESLGGLIALPEGGWDALTCVQARANGYSTRTFVDLVVHHLKPRNSSQGGAIRRKWQMGMRDYALGYHPLFEMLKCGSRILNAPLITGAVAWLAGYFWCLLSRKHRPLSLQLVRRIRQEQLDRILQIGTRMRSGLGCLQRRQTVVEFGIGPQTADHSVLEPSRKLADEGSCNVLGATK